MLRSIVDERITAAADLVGETAFEEFFDQTMCAHLLKVITATQAHEGSVWLLDEARSHLIPRFNSGPNAADFVGSYRLSLREGMISMVVATEQPICENAVFLNERQSKDLDRRLGLLTCAMLAVPFYFGGELRGVISAVQLKPSANSPEPPGFTAENLETLHLGAAVLSRMVDHQLLSLALGRGDVR
ncbi:MAG: GAF domain-containing protein [Chthoniobacter sp.]|nr:GAF domain-containing protein [Chthoniobacter sp.]